METSADKKLIRAKKRIAILEKMIEDKTRQLYLEHQESERNRHFLDKILSSMSSAVVVADQNLQVILLNDSALTLLGGTPQEFLTKPLYEVLAIDEIEPIKSVNAIDELLDIQAEAVLIRQSDQQSIPVLYAFSKVQSEDNKLEAIVCLLSDLSLFKALERQLLQAQKLESVGQLAAGVAHEINTPIQYVRDNTNFAINQFKSISTLLTNFQSYLEVTKDIDQVRKERETCIKLIEDLELSYLMEEIPSALNEACIGTESVVNIVHSMKEFSHPGSQEKTLIDLNSVIQSTITVSRHEWKYVAEIALDLESELPLVDGYPGELNQVVLNLIVNAAHAISDVTDNGSKGLGKIGISTKKHKGDVQVTVTDSGSGIPNEIKHKIFDPFFTTKEIGKGTGQGLAIVHSTIVDRHQGRLEIESQEGQGATFRLFLPISSGSA